MAGPVTSAIAGIASNSVSSAAEIVATADFVVKNNPRRGH